MHWKLYVNTETLNLLRAAVLNYIKFRLVAVIVKDQRCLVYSNFRGFNKHRRPTKHVGYFAHRSQLPFFRKKQLV